MDLRPFSTDTATPVFAIDISALDHEGGVSPSPAPFGRSDLGLGSTHRVYNFEVAEHHNYVADGVRVHNTSVLSFLKPHEFDNIVDLRDVDNDGDLDFAVLRSDDGLTEVEVTLQDGAGNSVETLREVTGGDGRGNVTYGKYTENADGSITWIETPRYVQGQFAGEAIGAALTPFLTRAIIGEGGSIFEQIAVDTVLGTVLENVGGTVGAFANIAALNEYNFAVGQQIDVISEKVFEDFGGELITNGIDTAVSVVNNLIMAEIFEGIAGDGIGGAVFESLAQTGLGTLVSNGSKLLFGDFLIEVFDDGVVNAASFANIEEWAGSLASFDDVGITTGHAINPLSIALNAVLNEILPAIESVAGQIASVVTSTLVAVFSSLGSWAGPVGTVLGFFVGKVFDELFGGSDPIPQAWTNVGYDADAGRFVVFGTWEDDGGDTGLSRAIAQAYVDGMNGFIDTVMSQSHNYDELAQWSFGHYLDYISNVGSIAHSFYDMQSAYIDAYVTDVGAARLRDGQMSAVRALEQINIEQLRLEYDLFKLSDPDYLSGWNLTVWDNYNISIPRAHEHSSASEVMAGNFARLFEAAGPNELLPKYFMYFLEWPPHAGAVTWNTFYTFVTSSDWDTLTFRQKVQTFVDTPQAILDFGARQAFAAQLASSDFETFAEYIEEFNIPARLMNNDDLFTEITSRLAVASDYHLYLENQLEIDTQIRDFPDTAFAAGWFATLALADEMGLNDPYNQTGDAIDNLFYTAEGNDSIWGMEGNDTIKTYAGDDLLYGGDGNDHVYAGYGNDEVYAGDGDDQVWGGNGSDTVNLNKGNDTFFDNDQDGELGRDTVSGGNGNDTIYGGGGDDDFRGQAGDDLIYGGIGNDLISGGVDNDTIFAGAGDDQVWGDNGSDWVMLGDGADIFHDNDQNGPNSGDTVNGALGDDTINGGGGNDEFHGEDGSDLIYGGMGNDTVYAGADDDEVWGDEGADWIVLGDGADVFHANQQDAQTGGDTVGAGDGDDTLYGGAGADELHGEDGFDLIYGHIGNDTIYAGIHADTVYAGVGDDEVWGGNGRDWIILGEGADVFHDNTQNDEFGLDTVFGAEGDDTINGGGGDDSFYGDEGNDSIQGGAGNDLIYGGTDADILNGGAGNDTLDGGLDGALDVFIFQDDFGNDTVQTFGLGEDVINLAAVTNITDFADLSGQHLTQVGLDAVITDGTNTITILNTDVTQLTAHEFIFV